MITFNEIPSVKNISEEDKLFVFNVCKIIFELSNKARREGLLALEEELDNLGDVIPGVCGKALKEGLSLVVDGNECNAIEFILGNFFKVTEMMDIEKLCFMLVCTGIISIQQGDNPYLVARYLKSYLGFDVGNKLMDFLEKENLINY